jgi:integrase
MEYMTRDELVRLFKVARDHNRLHHVAMLVGLLHGLRVSEMLAIRGCDICDGMLSIKRLKKSRATLHSLRFDSDVLFDESPLLALAQANDGKLFDWSRQYMDRVLKRYAGLAGLHPSKAHYHVLKHSICLILWQATHDLNAIQDHVGHRSASSTLVYLRAEAAAKAQNVIAGMKFSSEGRHNEAR